MVVQAYSPVLSELPYGRISGKAATATADSDGWYYKPGQPVKITADRTFAKTTASTDHVAGLVETGLNSYDSAGVLNANDRLGVALLQGKRVDVVVASETLAAGALVYINHDGKAVTATASTPTHGIVWKGGATDAEIEIIIF